MHTLTARRAPFWFVVLVTLAGALLLRVLGLELRAPADARGGLEAPTLAFWGVFLLIAEALWKGVEVAGKVALAILQYSVHLLWRVVVLIGQGARELAGYAWTGLRKAWDLFKLTYRQVIKPAWQAIWRWIDATKAWLERTFGPVINFLNKVRTWITDFYSTYVQPILDVIGIGRRVLGVFSAFGLEWARRLDRRLADLEARINAPFLFLIAQLNRVTDVINRIVTADGLFQRLALIRSIERDLGPIGDAFANWRSHPITPTDFKRLHDKSLTRTTDQVRREISDALTINGNPRAALRGELAVTITRALSVR